MKLLDINLSVVGDESCNREQSKVRSSGKNVERAETQLKFVEYFGTIEILELP